MKRTGSIFSYVGPAVMSILLYSRFFFFPSKKSSRACTMISGSCMRPFPSSPLARNPLAGSMIWFPYWLKMSRLRRVEGWAYMSRSIAGAMNTGAFIERYVVMSILSATPFAIFPIVAAVQGATSIASAHNPNFTWLFHVPSRCEKNSLITGFCVSAESVMGVMNSFPAGVITTCTSAPLFTSSRIM